MPFLTEPEPERGAVLPVMPGISRIVAANPGPMTYYGTNTYLIDTPDGLVVLDPGPEDHPEHVEAILRATGPNVALILVSHTHHDHVGAVPALQEATGAPTVGFPPERPRQLRGRHQARRWRCGRRHDGDPYAGPCVGSSVLRAAGERRHGGAVQRRPRDVVVDQRGQPAGRRHDGLLRQPAPAAGARPTMCSCPATVRRCRNRATLVREMLTHRMARERAIETALAGGRRRDLRADGHALFAGASAAAPCRRAQRAGASAEAGGGGQGDARRRALARRVKSSRSAEKPPIQFPTLLRFAVMAGRRRP